MAESKKELKSLLMKVKEEDEKSGLKLNIQETKIMTSGPITSWQIDGVTMETVTDFILLGSKITVDCDYSHEIKRCLLLGRKVMKKPRQHIKKQRHYFANKGLSSQGYGFFQWPCIVWELDYKESWALKNWCFWTVVLEKTLESPLDWKEIKPFNPKGNQSWIFIGRTDPKAEAPILWPPDAKSLLIWKDSGMLGKIESRRKRGRQKTRWLDGITHILDMSLSKFQEMVKDREVWSATVYAVTKSWAWLRDWTTTVFKSGYLQRANFKRGLTNLTMDSLSQHGKQ